MAFLDDELKPPTVTPPSKLFAPRDPNINTVLDDLRQPTLREFDRALSEPLSLKPELLDAATRQNLGSILSGTQAARDYTQSQSAFGQPSTSFGRTPSTSTSLAQPPEISGLVSDVVKTGATNLANRFPDLMQDVGSMLTGRPQAAATPRPASPTAATSESDPMDLVKTALGLAGTGVKIGASLFPDVARDIWSGVKDIGSEIWGGVKDIGTQLIGSDVVGSVGGAVGDVAGAVAPYAGAVGGLITGIMNDDPAAIASAGTQAGITALGPAGAGLIPAGAGIPIAAGAAIISNIIQDEIHDPYGRRSAAEDARYLMSQQVPGEARDLQIGAAALPLVSDKLSDEEAITLFQNARAGLKSSQHLAEPLARQGQQDYGVRYPVFGTLAQTVDALVPRAWLAAVRLQDILEKRGIKVDVPEYGQPHQELYQTYKDYYDPSNPDKYIGFQPGYTGEEMVGKGLYMNPEAAAGMIGHYGGFTEVPYAETAEGQAAMSPGGNYIYSPKTMEALKDVKPGELEARVIGYLKGLPGFASSALAKLIGQG
jgi:hypothetical protein